MLSDDRRWHPKLKRPVTGYSAMNAEVVEHLAAAVCILATTFAANRFIRSLFLASVAASVAASVLMHVFFLVYFGRLNELALLTLPGLAVFAFVVVVPVRWAIRLIRAL